MTDEPAEPESLTEAATPGRSLRGAAEDLSSLFGQEYEPDPGATALGPQRPVGGAEDRLGRSLETVTQRIAFLESELAGTVERVESVDGHLATTYQALQAVLQQLPDLRDGPVALGSVDLGPVESRLDTLAADVARSVRGLRDQIDALRGRLMSVAGSDASPGLEARIGSVEAALTRIAGRLASVEDRVASTLSHAESARDGLARLERSVEALHTAIGAGPVAPQRGDALTDERPASVAASPVLENPLPAQLEEREPSGQAPVVEEIPETSARPPSPLRPADAADSDAPPTPPEATPFWSSPGGS